MKVEKLGRHGIDAEFETVDLILMSQTETRGVDSFCLTWIKFERQLRKLVANLLYQATAFVEHDEPTKEALRAALLARANIKYVHFVGGIWRLTGYSVKQLLGEKYRPLKRAVDDAYEVRNKIFHGQQSGQSLDRKTLIAMQRDVREWCTVLATEAFSRFGYDGFDRDSLHKTHKNGIVALVDHAIQDVGWEAFIRRL